MTNRDKAVELLQHYFAIAMAKEPGDRLSADNLSEIEEIVDCIIRAAKNSS